MGEERLINYNLEQVAHATCSFFKFIVHEGTIKKELVTMSGNPAQYVVAWISFTDTKAATFAWAANQGQGGVILSGLAMNKFEMEKKIEQAALCKRKQGGVCNMLLSTGYPYSENVTPPYL